MGGGGEEGGRVDNRIQWFWNFAVLKVDLECGKNSKIKLQNKFFFILSRFLRKWLF
jgi:hypothetical protein